MKFGAYLLKEKGKIEEDELEDALKFQQENHIVLGVLAVRENLLNNKQLNTILDHQRVSGALFGDIAVELKFINEKGINRLLLLQNEKHNLLGEILVLYGVISKNDMEEELKRFHEAEGAKENNLMNRVSI